MDSKKCEKSKLPKPKSRSVSSRVRETEPSISTSQIPASNVRPVSSRTGTTCNPTNSKTLSSKVPSILPPKFRGSVSGRVCSSLSSNPTSRIPASNVSAGSSRIGTTFTPTSSKAGPFKVPSILPPKFRSSVSGRVCSSLSSTPTSRIPASNVSAGSSRIGRVNTPTNNQQCKTEPFKVPSKLPLKFRGSIPGPVCSNLSATRTSRIPASNVSAGSSRVETVRTPTKNQQSKAECSKGSSKLPTSVKFTSRLPQAKNTAGVVDEESDSYYAGMNDLEVDDYKFGQDDVEAEISEPEISEFEEDSIITVSTPSCCDELVNDLDDYVADEDSPCKNKSLSESLTISSPKQSTPTRTPSGSTSKSPKQSTPTRTPPCSPSKSPMQSTPTRTPPCSPSKSPMQSTPTRTPPCSPSKSPMQSPLSAGRISPIAPQISQSIQLFLTQQEQEKAWAAQVKVLEESVKTNSTCNYESVGINLTTEQLKQAMNGELIIRLGVKFKSLFGNIKLNDINLAEQYKAEDYKIMIKNNTLPQIFKDAFGPDWDGTIPESRAKIEESNKQLLEKALDKAGPIFDVLEEFNEMGFEEIESSFINQVDRSYGKRPEIGSRSPSPLMFQGAPDYQSPPAGSPEQYCETQKQVEDVPSWLSAPLEFPVNRRTMDQKPPSAVDPDMEMFTNKLPRFFHHHITSRGYKSLGDPVIRGPGGSIPLSDLYKQKWEQPKLMEIVPFVLPESPPSPPKLQKPKTPPKPINLLDQDICEADIPLTEEPSPLVVPLVHATALPIGDWIGKHDGQIPNSLALILPGKTEDDTPQTIKYNAEVLDTFDPLDKSVDTTKNVFTDLAQLSTVIDGIVDIENNAKHQLEELIENFELPPTVVGDKTDIVLGLVPFIPALNDIISSKQQQPTAEEDYTIPPFEFNIPQHLSPRSPKRKQQSDEPLEEETTKNLMFDDEIEENKDKQYENESELQITIVEENEIEVSPEKVCEPVTTDQYEHVERIQEEEDEEDEEEEKDDTEMITTVVQTIEMTKITTEIDQSESVSSVAAKTSTRGKPILNPTRKPVAKSRICNRLDSNIEAARRDSKVNPRSRTTPIITSRKRVSYDNIKSKVTANIPAASAKRAPASTVKRAPASTVKRAVAAKAKVAPKQNIESENQSDIDYGKSWQDEALRLTELQKKRTDQRVGAVPKEKAEASVSNVDDAKQKKLAADAARRAALRGASDKLVIKKKEEEPVWGDEENLTDSERIQRIAELLKQFDNDMATEIEENWREGLAKAKPNKK